MCHFKGEYDSPMLNLRRLCGLVQTEKEVGPVKEQLAQSLFDHIPVGVGSQGIIPTTMTDLEAALKMGMDYSVREVGTPNPAQMPSAVLRFAEELWFPFAGKLTVKQLLCILTHTLMPSFQATRGSL